MRSSPQSLERRRLCGRRDIKRSDWRDGRAAAITSNTARLRAWRVLGVAIWPVKRAAQPISAGQFAKRAVARSAMTLPAIPGHGRAARHLPRAMHTYLAPPGAPRGSKGLPCSRRTAGMSA